MKTTASPARVLARMIAILQLLLKNEGEVVNTKDMVAALEIKGMKSTLRTIQRDLVLMQSVGLPIMRYGHSAGKNGWYAASDRENLLALQNYGYALNYYKRTLKHGKK